MNKNLAKALNLMTQKDQKMRKSATKTGVFSSELDKENAIKLKKIIKKYGWPTIGLVGKKSSRNAWLIAQHADHDLLFQKKVLKLLKEIYYKNNLEIDKSNIAFLEDRILIKEGKRQIFGTQFYTNKKGIFGPRPVRDIKNIDKLRKEYKLPPFKDYLKLAKSYKQPAFKNKKT